MTAVYMLMSSVPMDREEVEELDRCLYQIAQNDPEALKDLYLRTSTSVYAFALSMLKNAHDAEDVLHDCYLRIHASAAGYESDGKPMAWILTIVKNLCRMKMRQYGKTADVDEDVWSSFPAADSLATEEDKIVLRACLERLSDEERQIVVLHAVSGMKHREIAQITDIPLPTVLSKYHRAIKKMKQFLEEGV